MSRDLVDRICAELPGAVQSDPFHDGHDVWTIGGKWFALIGTRLPGVSVKTDSIETVTMLIEAGVGQKAPYFHRSWVFLPWGTDEEEFAYRIERSYRIIRASLPRKLQASLGS